jgi:hypothetical protein
MRLSGYTGKQMLGPMKFVERWREIGKENEGVNFHHTFARIV